MKSLLITLTVIGCFIALTSYSYGRAYAMRPHPIALHITGEPDMDIPVAKTASAKEVKLFFKRIAREAKAHEAAATIAKIYGVTAENMSADIFGRGK